MNSIRFSGIKIDPFSVQRYSGAGGYGAGVSLTLQVTNDKQGNHRTQYRDIADKDGKVKIGFSQTGVDTCDLEVNNKKRHFGNGLPTLEDSTLVKKLLREAPLTTNAKENLIARVDSFIAYLKTGKIV